MRAHVLERRLDLQSGCTHENGVGVTLKTERDVELVSGMPGIATGPCRRALNMPDLPVAYGRMPTVGASAANKARQMRLVPSTTIVDGYLPHVVQQNPSAQLSWM